VEALTLGQFLGGGGGPFSFIVIFPYFHSQFLRVTISMVTQSIQARRG